MSQLIQQPAHYLYTYLNQQSISYTLSSALTAILQVMLCGFLRSSPSHFLLLGDSDNPRELALPWDKTSVCVKRGTANYGRSVAHAMLF